MKIIYTGCLKMTPAKGRLLIDIESPNTSKSSESRPRLIQNDGQATGPVYFRPKVVRESGWSGWGWGCPRDRLQRYN